MKKSKKSSEEPRDRLSELPDSIIFEIFWLLPMDEVVQTTILSKRWNNLWTTTPYLNFFGHDPDFVNWALILWKGLKVLKFKFGRVGSSDMKSVFSDIDVWVRFCRENGVEELYLEDVCSCNVDPRVELCCVTHNLYSCSSLKVLYLENCKLQNHGIVQWNQLRSLTIEDCILDQHLITKVVSGSPQLEVFILRLADIDENLCIQSSSLKKLSIARQFIRDEDPPAVSELRIWSPNVETLDIGGAAFGKCLFMNVSSLTHLTLDLSCKMREDDISGETSWTIFPTIQHVDKELGDMKEKYLVSPLSNVKSLSFTIYDTQYKEILAVLLHIFPKLETLVFRSDAFLLESESHDTSFLQVERNIPKSFLLQLRTVVITLAYEVDDLVFPFIEILLKHASKLQKMVFRVEGINPPPMPWCLGARQKVLRMQRSSPTAELIIC